MREEVFSSQLRAGSKTYFFDVKKALNGKLYLDITESRKNSEGSYERHNIMIFEEDLKYFKYEISEIYEKFFFGLNLHSNTGKEKKEFEE